MKKILIIIFILTSINSMCFASRSFLSFERAIHENYIILTGRISKIEVKTNLNITSNVSIGKFYNIVVEHVIKGDNIKEGDRLLIYDHHAHSTSSTELFGIKNGAVFLQPYELSEFENMTFKVEGKCYHSLREIDLEKENGKKSLEGFIALQDVYNIKDKEKKILSCIDLYNENNDGELKELLIAVMEDLKDSRFIPLLLTTSLSKTENKYVRNGAVRYFINLPKSEEDTVLKLVPLIKDNDVSRSVIHILEKFKVKEVLPKLFDIFDKEKEQCRDYLIDAIAIISGIDVVEFFKKIEKDKSILPDEYIIISKWLDIYKQNIENPRFTKEEINSFDINPIHLGSSIRRLTYGNNVISKENDIGFIGELKLKGNVKKLAIDFLQQFIDGQDKKLKVKAKIALSNIKDDFHPTTLTLKADKEEMPIGKAKFALIETGNNESIYLSKHATLKFIYEVYYNNKRQFTMTSYSSSNRTRSEVQLKKEDFIFCNKEYKTVEEVNLSNLEAFHEYEIYAEKEYCLDGEEFGYNTFLGSVKSNTIKIRITSGE